jgi:hypothetical protein
MDSNALNCAEEANSTDCLLRILLQFLEDAQKSDNEKFDWDPITFGFTVPIAVIAASFAIIPIYQAVLAAGQGRRKCSPEAIGKWSKCTKRKWKVRELGILYIAKTPILTIESVAKYLQLQDMNSPESQSQPCKKAIEVGTKFGFYYLKEKLSLLFQKRSSDTVTMERSQDAEEHDAGAASWYIFLHNMGLSDFQQPKKDMVTTLADYLPGDLLAVPARIEVRLAFVLMAMFNESLRVQDAKLRFPNLIGKQNQFEIRPHPTLGTVGAFSSYETIQKAKKLSKERLELAFKNAEGTIILSSKSLFSTLQSWRQMLEIKIVDYWIFYGPIADHRDNCEQCRHSHDMNPGSFTLPRNTWLFYGFLFGKAPVFCPAAFPWSVVPSTHMFEALAISGNIATNGKVKLAAEKDESYSSTHIFDLIINFYPNKTRCLLSDQIERLFCPCNEVLDACSQLLLGFNTFSDWVTTSFTGELPKLRMNVLKILCHIDSWLVTQDDKLVTCRAAWLLTDTMCLQQLLSYLDTRPKDAKTLSIEGLIQLCRQVKRCDIEDSKSWYLIESFTYREAKEMSDDLTRRFNDISILERIGRIIKTELTAKMEWIDSGPSKSGPLPIRDWKDDNGQLITRVLAFRAMLSAILYYTAHDNTSMLSSGIWEQIIPMI